MTAVAAVAASALPAQAVTTSEVYRYPPGYVSSVALSGHGYGHGHGLSQWGAYGAATQGLTWPQILAFYYPNTTRTTPAQDPTVRIRLDQLGTSRTYLLPPAASQKLTLVMGRPAAKTVQLPLTIPNSNPAKAVKAYQILRNGSTLKVQLSDGSVWSNWDPTGNGTAPSTPFIVSAPGVGTVTTQAVKGTSGSSTTATTRVYRGSLVVYPGTSTSDVRTVNELTMDFYLRGVIPSEMPASWASDALAAQAVAARTYAQYEREHASSRTYDLCDITACQVYRGMTDNGTAVEQTRTNDAVATTARTYLTYGSAAAFTQFSASNGGWATDGGQPYMVAKQDPYDGVVASSAHSWTATLSISSIQNTYPSIGTFTALKVNSRDGNGEWRGRVLDMQVVGTAGSVSTTGASFAAAMGLRHQWFKPTNAAPPAWPRDFSGDGLADVLGRTSADHILMHRGDGKGGWIGSPVDIGQGWGGLGARVFTAGPWNQDPNPDLLDIHTDGTLWLYAGDGQGGFASPVNLGSGWAGYTLVVGVGDVTGDGLSDLLARGPDTTLYIIPGDGHGTWGARRSLGKGWGGFSAIFSPGDFNRDGKVDLITRDASTVLWFYPGNGNGTFGPRASLGAGWGGYAPLISAGDFNGDGVGDVLARRSDGALVLWRGSGTGRFASAVSLGTGWNQYAQLLP
jgi:SpoIID/LytB domain protein